jgi:hypothetical protein
LIFRDPATMVQIALARDGYDRRESKSQRAGK